MFNALGVSNWEDLRKLKERFEEIMKCRQYGLNDTGSRTDDSIFPRSDYSDEQIKVCEYKRGSNVIFLPSIAGMN